MNLSDLKPYIALVHKSWCLRKRSDGRYGCTCGRKQAAEKLEALIGSGFQYRED